MHNSGASRRGAAKPYLAVIASEAKQSTLASLLPHGLLRGACHRTALCADPLARNDDQVSELLRGRAVLCAGPLARNDGNTAVSRLIGSTRRITPLVDRPDGSIAHFLKTS
jgi:hypothetical protein